MRTLVMTKRGHAPRLLSPCNNSILLVRCGQRITVPLGDGWLHLNAMLQSGWQAGRVL